MPLDDQYPPLPPRQNAPLPQLGSDHPIQDVGMWDQSAQAINDSGVAKNWTGDDSKRQIVYAMLHGLDWGQTRDIASQPGKYKETNPILGPHPHPDKVNAYFGATGLGHVATALLLSDPKWREMFQKGTIGLEAGVTKGNANLGLRMKW